MVVSTKIVKNEQHKLAATFLNNIAVGCVLLALIGPLATGRYAHFLTLEFRLLRRCSMGVSGRAAYDRSSAVRIPGRVSEPANVARSH